MVERKGPRGPKHRGPIADSDWTAFEKLCGLQCTLVEIAAYFNCDTKTIQTRVKEHYGQKFSDVYKRKRLAGVTSLRRIMMQKALGGNIRLIEILARHYFGIGDGLPVDADILKDEDLEATGGRTKQELEEAVSKRLARKEARDDRNERKSRAST